MRLILTVVAFVACTVAGATVPPRAFDQGESVETTEGHATLSWTVPDAVAGEVVFRLEESASGEFHDPLVRYEGPDQAVFVSGLHDGPTYYRVRAESGGESFGPWSQVLEVRTEYPSAGRVTLLMNVGGIVFVATVVAVAVGHLRHGREVV